MMRYMAMLVLAVLSGSVYAQNDDYWMPTGQYSEQRWDASLAQNVQKNAMALVAEMNAVAKQSATAKRLMASVSKIQFGVWCTDTEDTERLIFVPLTGLTYSPKISDKEAEEVKIGFAALDVITSATTPSLANWYPDLRAIMIPGLKGGNRYTAVETFRTLWLAKFLPQNAEEVATADIVSSQKALDRMLDELYLRGWSKRIDTLAEEVTWSSSLDGSEKMNMSISIEAQRALDQEFVLRLVRSQGRAFCFSVNFSVGLQALRLKIPPPDLPKQEELFLLGLERSFRGR